MFLCTKKILVTAILLAMSAVPLANAQTDVIEQLLMNYQKQGAGNFNAESGKTLWYQSFAGKQCTDCHGDRLQNEGKNNKTGKKIDPMAPSVNSARLTDSKKIEKWFLRNCKSVIERECTPQEKGDVLLWLSGQ